MEQSRRYLIWIKKSLALILCSLEMGWELASSTYKKWDSSAEHSLEKVALQVCKKHNLW